METSLKLQMDVKNNAEELRRYMLDLQNWEEEMKQKESSLLNGKIKTTDIPPPRNKIKRNNSEKETKTENLSESEKKPKKIQAYDYSAWDKYDVDKACAEIDKEPEEEPVSPCVEVEAKKEENVKQERRSLKNIDEAFYEKDLGNQFVRKEKWEDAIKCYTRAIELDPCNAIYYANRALCFIKTKNFKAAEVDSTVAIQLDGTYVKAYQRRATARGFLKQYEEATSDYKQILKLEPNNSLAASEIKKLEKNLQNSISTLSVKKKPTFNPKSIFKPEIIRKVDKVHSEKKNIGEASRLVEDKTKNDSANKNISNVAVKKELDSKSKNVPVSESLNESNEDVFGKVPEGFNIINPIHVPPHQRSKEPMVRIPIRTVFSDSETFDELSKLSNENPSDERKEEDQPRLNSVCKTLIEEKPTDDDVANLSIPETCVQFQQAWKLVKTNPKYAYSYLKKIELRNLSKIFKHSLESDLFSELISNLSNEEMIRKDPKFVYSFLYNLSTVHRFGSLVLFMSSPDKENLKKCISELEFSTTREELGELCEIYELPIVV